MFLSIVIHWLDVKKRIVFKILLLSHKSLLGLAPTYIQDMFQYTHHGHTLKISGMIRLNTAEYESILIVVFLNFNLLLILVSL